MRANRVIAFGLAVILSSAGCTQQPPAQSAVAPSGGPAISIVKPEKRPVTRVIEQPGNVQAFEETVLYPKIPGYVRALAADPAKATRQPHDRLIDIGSRVKADQILVELAVPELEEEFKQKEALVRQAEAEVAQAKKAMATSDAAVVASKAQVTETRAGLTRAQALYDRWKSESDRVDRLVKNGVIDTQTKDETLNQFKAAEATRAEGTAKVASSEAAVAKVEADRDKSAADVVAAEARLDVAKANTRRVGVLLAYTRVKAPYDGVVTRRTVNTGDYVTADGKHGLFAVAKMDPVRVVVNVPEADAGLVEDGQSVRVTLPATTGPPTVGKVVRNSWSLEPGSRTLRTEVDLPNPDGKLRPGMYVSARLTVELPAEWSVPAAAVGKINDEPVMYLAENGKAVRMVVQLHRGDAQFTQILRYRQPNATEWTAITGEERIATPASAVTDGQVLP
ncbi:MAG: efflux RND transporter periplasmic adaptor subunit [Bacteroidales bacterium]|nr:efflux RND transporter periplasmic adaptor subunit [Bacteroidales bacterium]